MESAQLWLSISTSVSTNRMNVNFTRINVMKVMMSQKTSKKVKKVRKSIKLVYPYHHSW